VARFDLPRPAVNPTGLRPRITKTQGCFELRLSWIRNQRTAQADLPVIEYARLLRGHLLGEKCSAKAAPMPACWAAAVQLPAVHSVALAGGCP